MPKHKTLEETYDSCISYGYIDNIGELNPGKSGLLLENSKTNVNSANIIAKAISKESKEWLNVYTLHYEALRMLAESFLLFDKINSANHQCLFSALCTRHPELEFDWSFFEKVRTRRHGANYYGEQINYKDWKEIELQMRLYISALTKEIEKKLKND